MYDIRSGRLLKTFVGHKGSVQAVHLCDLQQESHLFSCSLDMSIKLWSLETDEHRPPELGPEEAVPMNSWPYPTAINDFQPVVLEDNLRLFAGCQDSITYMRSMAASALTAQVCVYVRARTP